MRIVRKSAQSCNDIDKKEEITGKNCDECKDTKVKSSEEIITCKYGMSCNLIMQAIEELSTFAETDDVAKNAIADLSVVYFELQ